MTARVIAVAILNVRMLTGLQSPELAAADRTSVGVPTDRPWAPAREAQMSAAGVRRAQAPTRAGRAAAHRAEARAGARGTGSTRWGRAVGRQAGRTLARLGCR